MKKRLGGIGLGGIGLGGVVLAASGALLTGCSEDEPRIYTAPADAAAPVARTPASPGSAAPGQASPRGMTWRAPEGWRELEGDRPMRVATLQAGEGDTALEVAISAFPGAVGGPVANLNRWREQFGLRSVEPAAFDEHVERFQAGETSGWTLRIEEEGPDPTSGMLGAIIEGDPSHIWFIRATGAPAVLDVHEAKFIELAHSFVPGEPPRTDASGHDHSHHDPSPHAPHPGHAELPHGVAPAATELTWSPPAEWRPTATSSPIVYASFEVGEAAGRAIVTVTPLRGDGGGLLANVNMWRGQLGLAPVESLASIEGADRAEDSAIAPLQLPAGPATLVELHGTPDPSRGPLGVLVAIVPQGERTWFVRMTGPSDTLRSQRDVFAEFLRSIQFQEG